MKRPLRGRHHERVPQFFSVGLHDVHVHVPDVLWAKKKKKNGQRFMRNSRDNGEIKMRPKKSKFGDFLKK